MPASGAALAPQVGMKLHNIVVGIDFSPESEIALAQAESIARQNHGTLMLVHSVGVTEAGHYMLEVAQPGAGWTRHVQKRLEEARRELRQVAERSRARGASVEHHIASGFPDEALVEQATKRRADLVVVGTQGRSAVDHFLLGSVAQHVVRLAPCPVLVARRSTAPEPPRRLLVPTDFSRQADTGLDLALTVAAPGAIIELLHCWHPPSLLGDETAAEWHRDARAAAEQRGRQLVERRTRRGVTLELALSEEAPARGILRRLEEGRYDLVVIGSHGRRGLRRAILGSVAERVVRHAPISVLVAHGA
jgi:nucleotide-binding universal stress UspA family protein